MSSTHDLGRQGEEAAARYLKEKGYAILETNWRFHHNELDLIARDGCTLVVAEVKTRRSNTVGEPEMAVTREKQRAIIRSANAFVKLRKWSGDTRFDILSILIRGEDITVNHIIDAFYPMIR